jgi:hypothetical protein
VCGAPLLDYSIVFKPFAASRPSVEVAHASLFSTSSFFIPPHHTNSSLLFIVASSRFFATSSLRVCLP